MREHALEHARRRCVVEVGSGSSRASVVVERRGKSEHCYASLDFAEHSGQHVECSHDILRFSRWEHSYRLVVTEGALTALRDEAYGCTLRRIRSRTQANSSGCVG